MPIRFSLLFTLFLALAAPPLQAQEGDNPTPPEDQLEEAGPMTVDRLEALVRVLDEDAERVNNSIVFSYAVTDIGDVPVTIVTDPAADRMRIVIGIAREASVTSDRLHRMMQANFDSALDARYALAQEILWATFIHPLSSLGTEEFLSGLGQTLNLVATYGTTYSSGVLMFGGGDSQGILENLLEEFRESQEPEV